MYVGIRATRPKTSHPLPHLRPVTPSPTFRWQSRDVNRRMKNEIYVFYFCPFDKTPHEQRLKVQKAYNLERPNCF